MEIPQPEFCPISKKIGRVRDTRFGMNVSNKMLVNAAKFQKNLKTGKT